MNTLSQLLKVLEEISKKKQEAADLLSEIRLIIGDANRAGMAGSFKARKDELLRPLRFAEGFMNSALLAVAGVSFWIVWPAIGQTGLAYGALLLKFTILFPLYWIAWSSSRKYSHLTRIREDYAYKYAAAMAFEGYSKHTEKDPNLHRELLRLSLETMGNNPIRLYNTKNIPSSPLQESLNSIKELIKTAIPISRKDDDNSEEDT